MGAQRSVSPAEFVVERLGFCAVRSPLDGVRFTGDRDHVLYHGSLREIRRYLEAGQEPPYFVAAGPRDHIYFAPAETKVGIVTCGGLCPGLNDVVRALVLSAHFHYGIGEVYGFRFGYEGLNPACGHEPLVLTPPLVESIGELGGTILGSSRGEQPVEIMVDTLERMGISILFAIGGDGTLRGIQAIHTEVQRRGLSIAIVGIPKTIDNDISYIQQSFGFQTAAEMAHMAVAAANTEATGVPNGIGLVKLMGRESGFIAANTALVDSMVNFCLIPESLFSLEGFLSALESRIRHRHHAVVAVAEGAGQHLLAAEEGRDKSGNAALGDIGLFLRDRIRDHFRRAGLEVNLKYIDPSYMIRSVPANAFDSAFCLLLGHNAVHAGMAGFSNVVVGYWKDEFTLVPVGLAASARKRIDLDSWLWNSVLASTGQPRLMI